MMVDRISVWHEAAGRTLGHASAAVTPTFSLSPNPLYHQINRLRGSSLQIAQSDHPSETAVQTSRGGSYSLSFASTVGERALRSTPITRIDGCNWPAGC